MGDRSKRQQPLTYGKVGNDQSKTKTFETAGAAKKDADKVVKTKIKKGIWNCIFV